MVTDRVVALLENNIVPWRQPWYGTADKAISYRSNTEYKGINQMLLTPGEYLTFNNVKELGGNVKKGAKAQKALICRPVEKKLKDPQTGKPLLDELGNPKTETYFLYKLWPVFHIQDTEGIPSKRDAYTPPQDPISEGNGFCNAYVEREQKSGLKLSEKNVRSPQYADWNDTIYIPQQNEEVKDDIYFLKLFRAIVNSTGTENRLDRKGFNSVDISSKEYGMEELVKEMGCNMLYNCAGFGSEERIHESEEYCKKWIQAFKADSRLVIAAARKAEQAVKFVLNENQPSH